MSAITAGPRERLIADGAGWRALDIICDAGPHDPVFEERFEGFVLAAVLAGTFACRTDAGTAELHPGTMLFGNHGRCFACAHPHGRGDRCVSVQVEPELFAEIAATATGDGRFRFPATHLPGGPALAPWLARLESRAAGAGADALDAAIPQFVETVIATIAGTRPEPVRYSARDARRIAAVVRHLEARADEAVDLASLAALVGVTRYHFLRLFRRIVGTTPYRFLLALRMRRAAVELATTTLPITSIAFDVGAGDLATFNRRFRATYGVTPGAFRRANRTRPRHATAISPKSVRGRPATVVPGRTGEGRLSDRNEDDMFDHVSIGVRDIAASKRFYDAALQPLGYRCLDASEGSLGYGATRVGYWIGKADRPVPADPGSGLHFCFVAPTRAAVDAFHRAAVAAGGVDNGGPGPRPDYGERYYAAFVVDPDGYRIEAYCDAPA
jgi:AraC-like DNA-binding protein/catechol 2,3-dioxygenase-like lactoylglutathione lyase family enzyme